MTTTQPVDAIVARPDGSVTAAQYEAAERAALASLDMADVFELAAAYRALLAHMDGLALKAARYDWLAPRLIGADFDWNESGKCALVFEWPSNIAVGGSCDQNLDAAMAEGADR